MREQFEHTLQDKLQDFSMKTEPADWTRIERSLGLESPKRVPLYRYVAVAAAVLVLGICSFYLLRSSSPDLDDIQQIVTTARESANPIEKTLKESIDKDPAVVAFGKLQHAVNNPGAQQGGTPISRTVQDQPLTAQNETAGNQPQGSDTRTNGSEQPSDQTQPATRTNTGNSTVSSRPNSFLGDNRLLKTRKSITGRNWSLALYADGAGARGGNGSFSMNRTTTFSNASALEDFVLNEQANNQLVQLKVEETSGTYTVEVPDWDHQRPLSFGFMIRHNLTDRLGIETGITYSYLSSKQETSAIKRKQQLHYLGVPLGVVYTPFRFDRFDIYVRGAGTMDFNLAGRVRTTYETGSVDTRSFTNSNVQWSVTGNVGVMYNISDRFGFYLEPGVSHYFTFSNQPESYWKKNPTIFDLKLGFRTTF